MTNKIGVGITGSGFMGKTHAEALLLLPYLQLVAFSGGSRAPVLAEQYGVAYEQDAASLARRSDIDAVIVTTPHHVHISETLVALKEGKHVLVEKPLATSTEDCDRMIEAASRRGVTLGVGYHQRFRNNNSEACRLIREGAIGDILTIQVSMLSEGSLRDGGGWAWWDDPRSLGHILNSAPHGVDLLRWIMGAEVASVSALCRTFLSDAPVENTTLAQMSFENGALCSLFSTNVMPNPGFVEETFRFRIIGSKGLIDLDPYGDLKIATDGAWKTVSTQPSAEYVAAEVPINPLRIKAYRSQLQAWVDAMEGKSSALGSGLDGRAGVEVCMAILEASRTNSVVKLRT